MARDDLELPAPADANQQTPIARNQYTQVDRGGKCETGGR
jgi:hypothetical protein